MKSVYILLTKSDTYFSKMIHFATKDEYTHASIALDRDLRAVYSFGRKNPKWMLPAGLIHEDVRAGLFKRCESNVCCLCELPVSEEIYRRIEKNIDEMMKDAQHYRYNLLGTVFCKLDIDLPRKKHYFCSEFVSHILEKSDALTLPKSSSLMKPIDFFEIPGVEVLFCGELKQCLQ